MNLLEFIKADLNAYAPNSKFSFVLKTILLNHSFHMVLWIRLGQYFRGKPLIGNLFGIYIEYFIRVFFSSDISCKAKIGKGLIIMHGTDIVIGSKAVIGNNCKIFNGVTLGNKNTESFVNEHPILGDNIVIGSGAKVLGMIEVGNNVTIGANSVVINSVPNNSTAVGIPARIFSTSKK